MGKRHGAGRKRTSSCSGQMVAVSVFAVIATTLCIATFALGMFQQRLPADHISGHQEVGTLLAHAVIDKETTTVLLTTTTQTKLREEIELSVGRLAHADVHGNLGDPSLVTRAAEGGDWIRDRWQAAKDMSGSPIPGNHWLRISLDKPAYITRVVLDFETACASLYDLETSSTADGPWQTLTAVPSVTVPKTSIRPKHVVHTLMSPATSPWKSEMYVRAVFKKPGTQWGTSVWRFRVFGYYD